MHGVYFFRGILLLTVTWSMGIPLQNIASQPLNFPSALRLSPFPQHPQSTKMAPKRPLRPYTEEDMVNAMFDITNNGMSQYQATQKYGIPQTTISSRFRGQTALID